MSQANVKLKQLMPLAKAMYEENLQLKEELKNLLQTIWVLAKRTPDEAITIPDAELAGVPPDARLRVMRHEENKQYIITIYRDEEQPVVEGGEA